VISKGNNLCIIVLYCIFI